jgi:hypothetical protein
MLKKIMILIGPIVAFFVLTACGGTAAEPDVAESNAASQEAAEVQITERSGERLSADYSDALAVQEQLALGTLQLEETDLVIDEALAGELLPLWQALQSLSNSDTAAEAEINAVINQIQDSMTTEQIAAIAARQLTDESLTALLESGELGFGRGNFGRGGEAGNGPGGFAGGFPGGLPGGGPGGGGFPGGGPGGGGFGNFSEDDIATRQAQFAEGGFGQFQDQALTRTIVVLLQNKTGEAPQQQPGGIFNTVFTIVSEETGLSVEEIQTQTAEGITLAEIIETNGGDVEAVRALLVEALSELPNAGDLDVEQLASEWLGSE